MPHARHGSRLNGVSLADERLAHIAGAIFDGLRLCSGHDSGFSLSLAAD